VQKAIDEAVLPALQELGLEAKIAKEELRTKDFFCKICEMIQGSQFFLANLTNPTFNVGLELGLALGLNKIIILIASKKTRLPSDLVRQEVIFYSGESIDLKKKLIKMIKGFNKLASEKAIPPKYSKLLN
jgi:hypothetical protein